MAACRSAYTQFVAIFNLHRIHISGDAEAMVVACQGAPFGLYPALSGPFPGRRPRRGQHTALTPLAGYPLKSLPDGDQSLPMLWRISLRATNEVTEDLITIQNAALLHNCSELVHLVVLSKNSILNYLTLPRLERLGVEIVVQHPHVLLPFLHRSACTLRSLRLWFNAISFTMLDFYLRVVPAAVTELQVKEGFVWDFCKALRPVDILLQLKTISFCTWATLSDEDYYAIVAMLRARCQSSSPLDSFALVTSSGKPRCMPQPSTTAQLLALAAAGLKIKLTATTTIATNTHVIFNLYAA
ncbi:hypothetical protein C8R44DRAFT_728424 [Mycena epipterygia]|nr:hypothetical protein C8R44DRAFT_728424 [Mycena epipterygia]